MTTDSGYQAMSSQTLFGLLRLDEGICLGPDAMGCTVPIIVGSVNGLIEIPSLVEEPTTPDPKRHIEHLTGPIETRSWTHDGKPLDWGFTWQESVGCARVKQVLMRFPIELANLHSQSTNVRKALSAWRQNFLDYAELATRQRTISTAQVKDDLNCFDLFGLDAIGRKTRPYDDPGVTIVINDIAIVQELDRLRLEQVCQLSSIGARPPLEYRMQLSAYQALHASDYRKAIIETASVAELLITNTIRQQLAGQGISYADQLLKKFRMLSGRFELAQLIGISMPPRDYKLELIEPRNRVVHQAIFSEQSEAVRAVSAVDSLLGHLVPLFSKP